MILEDAETLSLIATVREKSNVVPRCCTPRCGLQEPSKEDM